MGRAGAAEQAGPGIIARIVQRVFERYSARPAAHGSTWIRGLSVSPAFCSLKSSANYQPLD